MNTPTQRTQFGATLLVGMIMLVVLTLLVVLALRSSNTNLRIVGNMQVEAEVSAATQVAIEQVVEEIRLPETDISVLPARTQSVAVGNTRYDVTVQAMKDKCVVETPVLNSSLNPSIASDVPCFESPDDDKIIRADNTLSSRPSACKTQQWEIEAGVNDPVTGASESQVLGISIRVPATTTCL